MSEETTAVTNTATAEPADDATVVHDEAAEEKAHDELVVDVTKMLDKTTDEDGFKPPLVEGKEEKPSEEAKAEPKDEEPATDADLGDELQARAEGAGISKELAQRLHQSGQLEETLAAFDRKLIERFSKEDQPKEAEKKSERREEKPPQKEPKDQEDAVSEPLSSYRDASGETIYEDRLVARDEYHQKRIDGLESQVAELLQDRGIAFEKRFDGMVDGLGHKDLFGKGDSAPKDKQANRDTLFRAYQAVCMAHDVDPHDCDPQWGKRALAAMFPDEVFKKVQRQTVDRLRSAEGKFLTSSKPRGAPPAKDATEEEVNDKLLSDVTSYLKKEGVQMSG